MTARLQEVLGVDAHDTRLIGLRHIREDRVHHAHQHAVLQRVARILDDGDDVGARLRHVDEVTTRSVGEFHSVHQTVLFLIPTLVNYGTNDIGHVGDGGSRSGSQIQHLASRLHEDVADTSLCSSAERQRLQSQQHPTWSGRGSTVCIPSFRRSFPVHQSTQPHPTGTSTEIFFSP